MIGLKLTAWFLGICLAADMLFAFYTKTYTAPGVILSYIAGAIVLGMIVAAIVLSEVPENDQ